MINLLTHGDIDILGSDGALYTSPSAHFIAGGASPSITGTLIPSGPIDIQGLSLGIAAFRPSLLYGSTILNFDPEAVPIVTPTVLVDSEGAARARYQLGVADAELSDSLPVFSFFPFRFPSVCYEGEECAK